MEDEIKSYNIHLIGGKEIQNSENGRGGEYSKR